MVFEWLFEGKQGQFADLLVSITNHLDSLKEFIEKKIPLRTEDIVLPMHIQLSDLTDLINQDVKEITEDALTERGLWQRLEAAKGELIKISKEDFEIAETGLKGIIKQLDTLGKILENISDDLRLKKDHLFSSEFAVQENQIRKTVQELKDRIFLVTKRILKFQLLREKRIEEIKENLELNVFISQELILRYKKYLKNYSVDFPKIIDTDIRGVISIIMHMKKNASKAFAYYGKAKLHSHKRGYNPGHNTRLIFLTNYQTKVWIYDITTPEEHDLAVKDKSGRYYQVYTGEWNRERYENSGGFKQIFRTIKEADKL